MIIEINLPRWDTSVSSTSCITAIIWEDAVVKIRKKWSNRASAGLPLRFDAEQFRQQLHFQGTRGPPRWGQRSAVHVPGRGLDYALPMPTAAGHISQSDVPVTIPTFPRGSAHSFLYPLRNPRLKASTGKALPYYGHGLWTRMKVSLSSFLALSSSGSIIVSISTKDGVLGGNTNQDTSNSF